MSNATWRHMDELAKDLRKVLDSPRHESLDNEYKAMVLLDLEGDGEYDPNPSAD